MPGMDSVVRSSSGRIIEISEAGEPRGLPVFTLHGTPASRVVFEPHAEGARKEGIRLISFSRPGYGASTRIPGRNIADGVSDITSVADALGIEKFAVWGHSGGSAYALACASVIPRRIVAASCLSGLAPYGAEGLDWFAGMGKGNDEEFKRMMNEREAWEASTRELAKMISARPAAREEVVQFLSSLLSEVDAAILDDGLAAFISASGIEGLKGGAEGWIDDSLAEVLPWGFDLASIHVPTQVWHGSEDKFCPFAHGQWLASRVPHTEAHLEEGEGHLTIFVNGVQEAQRWLASKFG
ncbi:MAG TPA: alpha/beta hydrolase [Nitrososphaerales archaeon]|nr:alpha/beta hydrolase [Nitrososphaerales archaeon]